MRWDPVVDDATVRQSYLPVPEGPSTFFTQVTHGEAHSRTAQDQKGASPKC